MFICPQSSAVIRMMENFLGVETFRKGIQVVFVGSSLPILLFHGQAKQIKQFLSKLFSALTSVFSVIQIYLKKHQFSNAKALDLWKAMSKVGVPCAS